MQTDHHQPPRVSAPRAPKRARRVRPLLLAVCLLSACDQTGASADDQQPTSHAVTTQPVPEAPLADSLRTPIQVRVGKATLSLLNPNTTVTGSVAPFRKATVASEVSGRVVARLVEPGDQTQAGQVLLKLDDERARIAHSEAKAQLAAREVDLAQAESEFRRGLDLQAKQFISDDALDALRFAKQRATSQRNAARASLAAGKRALADTQIRAPFLGTAERVHVQEGDFLSPGTPVVTLADFGRARVLAGVTAREATLLGQSEQAELTLDALGPGSHRGEIRSISRIADPATGTYTVEIWLDGALAPLREGMVATVQIPYAASAEQLTVPVAAVFRRDGGMHVYAVQDNQAQLRPVRTGRTDGQRIEIESGLAAGAMVVIDGQFALRDGAAVRIEGY